MSCSPSLLSFCFLNASVPLAAMTPRLFSSSLSVMPTPLSLIVSVRAALSAASSIAKSAASAPSVSDINLRLSSASDALEISSRKNISRLV